ncbi:hypothetical protein AC622_01920 [Bacillus sp. FJAT-27916]|uniref:hypothetical protein n=1 Tax=Bacillaceae TaxID=186817 RepID=UPI000670FB81|nr:hypothetical protein [Bacillus sp. FJAT-27916]KMY43166.1 hypothetical protein AC622_01920 [Bacillus sp. FJAT-27916]
MRPEDNLTLGDKIKVYAGDDTIGTGSFVSLSDSVLTWANGNGNITFTYAGTGSAVSIKKI